MLTWLVAKAEPAARPSRAKGNTIDLVFILGLLEFITHLIGFICLR
jgi:hypothetical protein